ncbi:hypothetical protein J3Q64DRAFT_1692559 [Phycomyces blakesleeanus]|uniref:Uncharacterized protein n=1 Tax=Phycomyces blakesleeanus TaxID=4837 RepID=A0ABR3BBL5_PHYBL
MKFNDVKVLITIKSKDFDHMHRACTDILNNFKLFAYLPLTYLGDCCSESYTHIRDFSHIKKEGGVSIAMLILNYYLPIYSTTSYSNHCSHHILSHPIPSYRIVVVSYRIPSHPITSHRILFKPLLPSHPVPSHPIVSYRSRIVSYPIPSHHIVSYRIVIVIVKTCCSDSYTHIRDFSHIKKEGGVSIAMLILNYYLPIYSTTSYSNHCSHHILSHPITSHPIVSYRNRIVIVSYRIVSHPIPSHHITSYRNRNRKDLLFGYYSNRCFHHILSHPITSHRIVSYRNRNRIVSYRIPSHHITSHRIVIVIVKTCCSDSYTHIRDFSHIKKEGGVSIAMLILNYYLPIYSTASYSNHCFHHILSHPITSHRIVSYRIVIVSYRIVSHPITSHHITSYRNRNRKDLLFG